MGKVLSIASGKGGVGKTSIVSNLGCLFAQMDRSTLLVDADWTLGKLGIALGVRPRHTIDRVLEGEVLLVDAIEKVRPGLGLLASPSGRVGFEELNDASRQGLFYQLDSLANLYDLVLLDHGSGIHPSVLEFAAAAHQHLIITTAEPTSYTDAYAIIKLLSKRFGVRRFGLIVTMSENQIETERVMARFCELAESQLGVRIHVIDILPWEQKLAESIRCQQPFVERYPGHDLTRRLRRVCQELDRMPSQASAGLRFFSTSSSIATGHP